VSLGIWYHCPSTDIETITVTFFYPSSEWNMVQPFDCLCGSTVRLASFLTYLDSQKRSVQQRCLGRVEGAISLSAADLFTRGYINPWISAQFEAKQREHGRVSKKNEGQ
jgi:hypothetical protein